MARGPYPSDKQDQYMLRFPDGMRDQLKAAAEANKRSMNAEIVARLEASLAEEEPGQRSWGDIFAAKMAAINERLERLEAMEGKARPLPDRKG